MNMQPKSLKDVRKAIATVHPALNVARHRSWSTYYFFSDDKEFASHLTHAQETTIYVNHWSEMSIEQWVNEAKEFLAKVDDRIERGY
jgi:hypothetical protein